MGFCQLQMAQGDVVVVAMKHLHMVIAKDAKLSIRKRIARGNKYLRQALQQRCFEGVFNALSQIGKRRACVQGLEVFVMQSGGTHASCDEQANFHGDIT